MNFGDQFLWVIYPYIVIAVFILGLILRYNTDQRGWSSKSSELLEKNLLKWGSLLFHIGIIFAFFGHVAGILVPLGFYRMLHIPDKIYHLMAVGAGGTAGIAVVIGLLILLYRRIYVKRIKLTSSTSDIFSIILLFIVVILGMSATVFNAQPHSEFDYRTAIGPWFRGLFTFTPNASLMAQIPIIFKIHIIAAFAFFAVIPFTRMVHLLSQPITYLTRSYIVYRKRA
jgi:nitrate reductase gamma subunit